MLLQRGISRRNSSFFESVDYTFEDLIAHLEKKFNVGMSWNNYGTFWHLDHVKPQSLFQYTSMRDSEFKECWALINLQPLEAQKNLSKGASFEDEYHKRVRAKD